MKLVIFGLTVSSSWGNGHATLWRGMIRALGLRGHTVEFFERDVPYYASHRDLCDPDGGRLVIYRDWESVRPEAWKALADADVAMVTSYCPDGLAATDLVLDSPARLKAFYDLDTPVTLDRLRSGETVSYIGPRGLKDFDLVLSYTGGAALEELRTRLGARRTAPLYGHVDPATHHPVSPVGEMRADLSYMGAYAEDRQAGVEAFFLRPARERPHRRFLLAGAMYPKDFPWTDNVFFLRHLEPAQHPAFFASSRLTLNVTRRAMAEMGSCPSGRLFEAAACGCPLLSDDWEGLDGFFTPGREILIARTTEDAIAALDISDAERDAIARAARERVLSEHTSDHRARDLESALEGAVHSPLPPNTGGPQSGVSQRTDAGQWSPSIGG